MQKQTFRLMRVSCRLFGLAKLEREVRDYLIIAAGFRNKAPDTALPRSTAGGVIGLLLRTKGAGWGWQPALPLPFGCLVWGLVSFYLY